MKLSYKEIIKSYDKVKHMALRAFDEGKIDIALSYIAVCADIAYNFNWIYTDDELEDMLSDISRSIIKPISYTPVAGKIVFYDVFAHDNRGLTQQYIRAIITWNVELLFVLEGDDLSHSSKIIEELNGYSKAELFIIDSTLSKVDKIKLLYSKISDFSPEKAFLHLHPSSVVAVTLWNMLPQTIRYQINLTDHAFWLGTHCIDYSLEFREYGYTVSLEKRGLKAEQLLIQPYYPITDCLPFQGFPPEVKPDNIVIFTGGSLYKMYGAGDTFFDLLKGLLNRFLEVVILIAGAGDREPLMKFVESNGFEKRILLLGNRMDINHVFENCDIYLSTYPLTGGLMGQYAAVNGKPILSYTTPDIRCNYTEGFLNWGDISNWNVTHISKETFFEESEKLVKSLIYREKVGAENKTHVISAKEFNTHLWELVQSNKLLCKANLEQIDYNQFMNMYLDIENNYLICYKRFILKQFGICSLWLFPIVTFKAFLSKKIIKKIVNKLINNY